MKFTNEIKSKVLKTAWKNYNDQNYKYGFKPFSKILKETWDWYKNNYKKETFKLLGGSIISETDKAIYFNAYLGFYAKVWLPKSMITEIPTDSNTTTYALPTWLWNAKRP